MHTLKYLLRLALWNFRAVIVAGLFLVPATAATAGHGELPQRLDGLSSTIDNTSIAITKVARSQLKISPNVQAGYFEAIARFGDSARAVALSIELAKKNQTPKNLYNLRADLGELSTHLNALTLCIYLGTTGGSENVAGGKSDSLELLNAAFGNVQAALFLYDLEVNEILSKN